ncbi:hypothetical protein EWM64_g4408 [Hericium alpestre]|uniref:ATP-dependent (S)-NAD(P)H-hydrate dehydratase n=1 Tax=Hericium alpestre TaxID=135208 RepID=A0A4Y9ZZH9_9AGAM|nr:hypothetical protein EWM64_g4408 [Hericium alpestre]
MGSLFSCCVATVEEELDYANDRVREIEKDVVDKVRNAEEEAVERVRDAEEDVTERVRDLEDDASSTRGRTDDDDDEFVLSTPQNLRPEMSALLSRLHVLVIGPGLGREPYMQAFARMALNVAKEQGMFLVIDADGLYLVGQELDLVKGYRRAVLTPNVVEFKRLSEQAGIDPKIEAHKRASAVSQVLGGVTILQKGANDIICANTQGTSKEAHEQSKVSPSEGEQNETIEVDTPGGLKRCGGQGDILSGAVGAFLAWGKCYEMGAFGDKTIPVSRMPILAAVGASMMTRATSRIAFEREGRGVVTQDMLQDIGRGFVHIFGKDQQGGKL